MIGRISFAILALVACAASSSAQRTPRQTTSGQNTGAQSGAKSVSPESADIAITATVTAKELRFEVMPNPTVDFPGRPERDTEWDAVRDNFARPVEPGVTYRDIGIRLKIVSRFADIDRIVSEALGEIPATDRMPQTEDANPQQQMPTPPSTPQPNGRSPK